MVYFVDGVRHDGYRSRTSGAYQRAPVQYRDWIRKDGSTKFSPEKGRYHLYVCYACPWAHRCLIMRKLKGLEDVIDISVVHPKKEDNHGWAFWVEAYDGKQEFFPGTEGDKIFGSRYLYEVYTRDNAEYTGNITVPLLWDKKTNKIVSNASEDIMAMLNKEFEEFATDSTDYSVPTGSEKYVQDVYDNLNNGVYKTGLANDQQVYESACRALFSTLDRLEERLSKSRYMCGNEHMTELDIRVVVTLWRFDACYYGLFKANLRRIQDYPNLYNYMLDIAQTSNLYETVDYEHIITHYWWSFDSLNPKQTVPRGGREDLTMPHDRNRFLSNAKKRRLQGTAGNDHQNKRVKGEFVRPTSNHRNHITADGSSGFKAEPGRYHLYVSNNCPWSHRTILVRAIKGLEDIVSMDVLYYRRHAERGWQFNPSEPGCTEDTVNGKTYLKEIYEAQGSKEGSVPVLFDKKENCIVSNESSEIIRMFNSEFNEFLPKDKAAINLVPTNLEVDIDVMNAWQYNDICNGAYRAGFTASQEAYDNAFDKFFRGLDKVETILAKSKWLLGDNITESDVRLFPTLFRFDHVYYTRFRLNKKMISEYPNISRWLQQILQFPGVREASNLEHCKKGYFGRTGNNIVPLGPAMQI